MAAQLKSLSQSEYVNEVLERMIQSGFEVDRETVNEVFAQIHEVALDEVEQGIPVNVCNVAKISVRFVPAKPRRMVFNPWIGEDAWAKAAPAKFRARAIPTTAVKNVLPVSAKSQAGVQLAKRVKKPARRSATR